MSKALSNRPVHIDFGILVLRIGVGLTMLIAYGYMKITAGPELWSQAGGVMQKVGISFAPTVWGFLAAFAESFGALLVATGFLFRPATLMVAFTMFMAALHHLTLPAGDPNGGFSGAAHAIELLAVHIGLFFVGAGRFSFRLRGENS